MNEQRGPTGGTEQLRDLVARRIDVQWERFEQRHPNLAASIERVELVDSVVEPLRRDPRYQRAMEQAGRDEAVLAAAGELVETIDRWVGQALGL